MTFRRYVTQTINAAGSVTGYISSDGLDRATLLKRADVYTNAHPAETVIIYEAIVSIGRPLLPSTAYHVYSGGVTRELTDKERDA